MPMGCSHKHKYWCTKNTYSLSKFLGGKVNASGKFLGCQCKLIKLGSKKSIAVRQFNTHHKKIYNIKDKYVTDLC